MLLCLQSPRAWSSSRAALLLPHCDFLDFWGLAPYIYQCNQEYSQPTAFPHWHVNCLFRHTLNFFACTSLLSTIRFIFLLCIHLTLRSLGIYLVLFDFFLIRSLENISDMTFCSLKQPGAPLRCHRLANLQETNLNWSLFLQKVESSCIKCLFFPPTISLWYLPNQPERFIGGGFGLQWISYQHCEVSG